MPVYYFHVRDGGKIMRDPEGLELPDIDSVREVVRNSILSVLRENQTDKLSYDSEFQIDDERGRTVLIVPFRLALHPDAITGSILAPKCP